MLYVGDHDDVYPFSASSSGFLKDDWVYWRLYPPYSTAYPVQNSPIVVELGHVRAETNAAAVNGASLFTCPMDHVPLVKRGNNGGGYYPFSYTMNSTVLAGTAGPNYGFSSVGAKSWTQPPFLYFRNSAVHHPSVKMVIVEEPVVNQAWDMPAKYLGSGSPPVADDGRWVPVDPANNFKSQNTLTIRHNGKANVTFADGHAAPTTYLEATNVNNVVGTF